MKIIETFFGLKNLTNKDLIIQIELYEKCQLQDEAEALGQSHFDLNNLNDVFNAICIKLHSAKKNNEKFLELLQLVFNIEDEKNNRNGSAKVPEIWNNLNECAREIIFGKNMRKTFTENSTQTEPESNKKIIKL